MGSRDDGSQAATDRSVANIGFVMQRALDSQLSAQTKLKGEDFLRRSRLFVATSLIGAMTLSALSASIILESGLGTAAIAAAIGGALFLSGPWLLRTSGSLVVAGNAMLGVVFTVMVFASLRTGGIGLPSTFFAGVLPITAAIVSGKRSAAFWGVAACIGLLTLDEMHMSGFVFPEAPSPYGVYARQFHGALAMVFVLGTHAVLYEWLKSTAVDALGERNQLLVQATNDLVEARARSEAILEATGNGIIGLDLDGRVTFVNYAALHMIGGDEEDLIGHPMHSMCHHSRSDQTPYPPDKCPTVATLRDGEARSVTNEVFWREDGTSFPVEYLSSPMFNEFEELIGAVVTFQNPGERRRVSEMGEILNQSLNEIFIFHADSLRFIHANRGALKNLQYTLEELQALTPVDLKPEISQEEFTSLLAPLRTWEQEFVKFRTVHQRKDGSLYPIEVHLQPSTFQSEPVFFAIVLEISAQKQLEAQLVHAQKLESLGHLAAGVAHEINTPIQFVGDNLRFLEDSFKDLVALESAYSLLLEATLNDGVSQELVERTALAVSNADREFLLDEIPRALSESHDGVQRVAKIVAAMKEFSHPGIGDVKEAIDLNHAIESTIAVAASEWRYVAEIVTDLSPMMPAVPCFRQEFNQVILVLIVNAAHAIAEAGGNTEAKGTITIVTRHEKDCAEIRVSDTGTGVPDAIRSKLFDPFFTTKEVGMGTGQGLAISYQAITEKHGGSLTFETTLGEGTTFIITLPLDSPIDEADYE